MARVVARVESDEKRDRTMLDSAALEFLDADGHVITDSSITVLEGEQVEVTIPVLKLKEVPLKFEFSNVPAGYDPAELNASISPATIRIAGAADTVDGIESVNAGFINLARVQLGKAETLKIQLSEGLVNVDDVQEATVTFDTSGYGEPRAITVSDIRVVNAPSGVDVKVITESINNVTLVGEAEELAAISPSDVIAQVDASAQNITVKGSGQQQFSAQIIVTGTKTVFAACGGRTGGCGGGPEKNRAAASRHKKYGHCEAFGGRTAWKAQPCVHRCPGTCRRGCGAFVRTLCALCFNSGARRIYCA